MSSSSSFSALSLFVSWDESEAKAAAVDLESETPLPPYQPTSGSKPVRIAVTMFAAMLMTAVGAAAAHAGNTPSPVASAPAAAATAPSAAATPAIADLNSDLVQAVKPLMPEGMRVDAVTLGCKPPADAVIKSVAPGVTQLVSRSFIVELASGDRTIACSASLSAQRQMLVARGDFQPEQPVDASDFKLVWVDAFSAGSGSLDAFPSNGPYAAATYIRAGQPLYLNQIARPIAVHPGELVMVLVKNGPVTVHTQLQSQSSAAVGETATMINPSSGTPILVTVTGPRAAELEMQ
jgi:flagella basal body P-ring formation protein FlgA